MADVGACHTIDVERHAGGFPCSSGMVNAGVHNTVDAQRHVGGDLPYLFGMGVDGVHNTVGKISAPTTLFGLCYAREVAGYCPAGVQGTFLGIVVDLGALLYFSVRSLVLTERASPVGWSQSALIAPVGEEQ